MERLIQQGLARGATQLLWPVLRGPGDSGNWRERWQPDIANPQPVALWLHSASLGEIAPLAPIVHEAANTGRVGITVTSGRSYPAVVERFGEIADVRLVPLPESPRMRQLTAAWGHAHLVLMEAELWPDLIRDAGARAARIAVLGGRLNPLTRWLWRRALTREDGDAVAGVWTSNPERAAAYRAIGIPADKVHDGFIAKLLDTTAEAPANEFRGWRYPNALHLVLGSLHPNEATTVARACKLVREQTPLRALIVPRHAGRSHEIAVAFAKQGVETGTWPDGDADVQIVARYGVLAGLYALADVALVGGSWNRLGGHNPVEAAVHGVPVIMGPSLANQADLLSALPHNTVTTATTAVDLAEAMIRLSKRAHTVDETWFADAQQRMRAMARAALGLNGAAT